MSGLDCSYHSCHSDSDSSYHTCIPPHTAPPLYMQGVMPYPLGGQPMQPQLPVREVFTYVGLNVPFDFFEGRANINPNVIQYDMIPNLISRYRNGCITWDQYVYAYNELYRYGFEMRRWVDEVLAPPPPLLIPCPPASAA